MTDNYVEEALSLSCFREYSQELALSVLYHLEIARSHHQK